MRMLMWTALAAALLTGCAKVDSSAVTPTLYVYSPEMQAQAADEIDALPEGSVLPRLIGDYAVVRAEIRALRGPEAPTERWWQVW